MSQRQLATRSGVAQETIARIEGERSSPRLSTFVRLLAGAGYGLVLVDQQGRGLAVDEQHDRIRDAAGRHLPAHLQYAGKPDYARDPYWWGWHRVAWIDSDVPEHIWFHRTKHTALVSPARSREYDYVWDDAT